jgi:hypothetical protein
MGISVYRPPNPEHQNLPRLIRCAIFVVLGLVFLVAGLAVWLAPRDPVQTELESYKRQLAANGDKLAKENWLPNPGAGNNGAARLVKSFSQLSTVQMISGVTHAYLRLRQNRPDEACDELAGLMELAQKTLREPNFASLNSRAEIAEELCQTTRLFLQFTNIPESRLHELQTAWEKLDLLGTVEPTFALERAMVEDREEAIRRNLSLSHKTPRELFDILIGLFKDFKGTRDTLRHNVLLTRQTYADEFVEIQRAQAELSAARSLCTYHAGASLKNKLLNAVAVAETQRQMAIAAIAIEHFHLEKGRYPETLSELQPAFLKHPPIDFMDGKLLRYRPGQDGLFLLYSVGLDDDDDGGAAWPAKWKNKSGFPQWEDGQDIVWPQPATDAEVAARTVQR